MRLIDADDLKYGIINKGQSSRRYKLGEIWELNFTEICEVIDEMPTAIEVKKDNDQKYECHLEYCAECDTSGSIMLTKEEYETVKRVANTDNWNNLKWSPFSGILIIWCDDLDLIGEETNE